MGIELELGVLYLIQAFAVGPGRIVGRVLDQESRLPIEGVTVALAPTTQQAETDARGRFEINDVSSGALVSTKASPGLAAELDTSLPGRFAETIST